MLGSKLLFHTKHNIMRPNRKDHRHNSHEDSKKPKNFVYCTSCQRNKMLFQTKEEADRFIKFNSDAILEESGKAPNRSYYCQLCAGWHLTSSDNDHSAAFLDRRDQRLAATMDYYAKVDDSFAPFAANANELLQKAKKYIKEKGDYDEAEEHLALLGFELEGKEFPPKYATKFKRIQINYRNLSKLVDCLRLVEKLTLEQMAIVNDKIDEYKNVPGFAPMFRNLYQERQILAILEDVKEQAPSLDVWAERKKEIEQLIDGIYNQGELFIKPRIKRELVRTDILLHHVHGEQLVKKEKNLSANEKAQFVKIIENLEKIQDLFSSNDFEGCKKLLDLCIWDTQYLPQQHSDVKNLLTIVSNWVQKVHNALI